MRGNANVKAYYNEIDPYAAQWLRNLIAAGHIAPGDVDERSVVDVRPVDLVGYTQCHFFAGIGVWSHALRGAGWADSAPVWTGSCPCQPFSGAGKGDGFDDERHLWPAFFHLIEECAPPVVFGEQVASKDGLAWLNLVQADLEGKGYAIGALDLCAAGFGAPHIRQRLYWVADAESSTGRTGLCDHGSAEQWRPQSTDIGTVGQLGHSQREGLEGHSRDGDDTTGRAIADRSVAATGAVGNTQAANGRWRDADWLLCRDDKWRAVEPGTFPLAHGLANRVGQLRAYGNAIVAPQAKEFIAAYLETKDMLR